MKTTNDGPKSHTLDIGQIIDIPALGVCTVLSEHKHSMMLSKKYIVDVKGVGKIAIFWHPMFNTWAPYLGPSRD